MHRTGKSVLFVYLHRVVVKPASNVSLDTLHIQSRHAISRTDFIWRLKWLSHWRKPLSLSNAIRQLKEGSLNEHFFVLSFDDGYRDVMSIAFPILKAMKIPFTVFISNKVLDSRSAL